MDNKEFAQKLEKRTLEFAIQIIRLSSKLPNTPEAKVVKYQITKAGTSIGANYREANRARSRADFMNKIRICESEASETLYWLEIIRTIKWLDEKTTQKEFEECKEFLALFTSISHKPK
ncbi:MAG: four helix bundle protein [Calditrichia bacterium]|jgi:four helix bundle protein|nr:four helix bundle protein [Calditrichia bacterium]